MLHHGHNQGRRQAEPTRSKALGAVGDSRVCGPHRCLGGLDEGLEPELVEGLLAGDGGALRGALVGKAYARRAGGLQGPNSGHGARDGVVAAGGFRS